MPSLHPDFEYDIFISYRQNDNRSGWVTEFVKNLNEELAATIKEPVSVYFDSNPHDGLLETHSVDKSLEGKLKCLIFIPILSQTYCDPKSFAWQNEFCAFNKLAKEDQLGRDIRLGNGNVASRILPVRIHDLGTDDKAVIENETGGVLRAVDFIFKSAGVNRPLRAHEDHPQDNLNNVFYLDQVNKVANAVKELVAAIKYPASSDARATDNQHPKPAQNKKMKAIALVVAIIVASAGYFLYPKIISLSTPNVLDKSIAVLPFVDMSPSHDQEYFADGLSEELLNLLAQIPELKVIGRTSSFQFKGKNEDLREIGKKLSVGRVLEGSVRKSEDNLKITAQLIDTRDGSHLWSQTFSRKLDDVFEVQDEIAKAVVVALKINMLSDSLPARKIPVNAEAYNAFVQGKFFYESNFDTSATKRAMHYFEDAIRLDSGFALPWTYVSMCYWRTTNNAASPEFKQAKRAAEKALELDPSSSVAVVNMAEILDNEYDFRGAEQKIKLALQLEPNNPYALRNAGRFYILLGRYDESINFCKQALKNDPIQRTALQYLTRAYVYSGQYANAQKILKEYEEVWTQGLADLSILILLEVGEPEEALKKLNSYVANQTAINSVRLNSKAFEAAAYFKSGKKKEALALCTQLEIEYRSESSYEIALAYAYGNEKEKALTLLEQSYLNREKKLTSLKVEHAFKPFDQEPRFQALVKKMNFPQ